MLPVMLSIFALVMLLMLIVVLSLFKVWLRALLSGTPTSLVCILGMRLRKVPATVMIDSRIMAVKAGIDLSLNELETHCLAGGAITEISDRGIRVLSIVQAMIMAEEGGVDLTFEKACAIDLAGHDVVEVTRKRVRSKDSVFA
ncbi:flotillin-like FloA family protein [Candidatus Hydrogenedentota bacterium]